MKEIYEEIKGFVNEKYKETKNDIDNVRKECNSVKNDIASLNEKIRKIETSELLRKFKSFS